MLKMRRSAFKRFAEQYLKECERRRLSKVTIDGYAYTLERTERTLREKKLKTHPQRIGEEEVDAILSEFNNSKWYLKTLNVFLNWNGNDIIKRMNLKWPKTPLRADWLTPEEAHQFYQAFMSMSPPYKTLGHLELCLGFRRISCKRALVSDFKTNHVIVHGKGRMGGKDYPIFPHPETEMIIEEAKAHNENLLRSAKSLQKSPYLFMYSKGKRVGRYSGDTSFDTLLNKICKVAGVSCSHHTLRRTFGRTLWEALGRRDIETIADIMGHESIEQTRHYLGIKHDDRKRAMTKLGQFQQNRREVYLKHPSQ